MMSIYEKLPKSLWRLMKLPRFLYRLGLHRFMGHIILLLTTTGRKSGLKRITPLQYEQIDGDYYVGSARGPEADWYRNILAYPRVEVQVKSHRFQAIAEPTTDPSRIVNFLQIRLERHPTMVGKILRSQGCSKNPTQEELERFAANSAMVVIRPIESEP